MSRKIFVGSLPATVTDEGLRAEFGKYGTVEDIYIKSNCEPSRQWAFVTFSNTEQANFAKESCDRLLVYPGHDRPCDVMLAKNQGQFGQDEHGRPNNGAAAAVAQPRKIFVGSLPDGVQEHSIRDEFLRYGAIEDIFIKDGCESGRQWCFITYLTPDEAKYAQEATNGIMTFPGGTRVCEVTLAKNQGMFGQAPIEGGPPTPAAIVPAAYPASNGPRKIFIGSLPDSIEEMHIRAEMSKYGQIVDVFLKTGQESGRNWAFITFAAPEQAAVAKQSCDRQLLFPGSIQPCEVTMAKHQGLFGQEGAVSRAPAYGAPAYAAPTYGAPAYAAPAYAAPAYAAPAPAPIAMEGPKKVFVGSLPDNVSEQMLRSSFSRYGAVTDVFLKHTNDSGRHWAFVTYASQREAQYAKEQTDRTLMLPGAEKPCEVMLAKNQGKFGQNQGSGGGGGGGAPHGGGYDQIPESQPPPPAAPSPHTPWRMYKTAAGLPYYHNHQTAQTQWDAPPELQVPGPPAGGGYGGRNRYSPY